MDRLPEVWMDAQPEDVDSTQPLGSKANPCRTLSEAAKRVVHGGKVWVIKRDYFTSEPSTMRNWSDGFYWTNPVGARINMDYDLPEFDKLPN